MNIWARFQEASAYRACQQPLQTGVVQDHVPLGASVARMPLRDAVLNLLRNFQTRPNPNKTLLTAHS